MLTKSHFTNSWLIPHTLNLHLIRIPSIHILSNIQERDSEMDKGVWSQLIQGYGCHPELIKHSSCLCYIWSKHSDGLCKLPLPKRWISIYGWSVGQFSSAPDKCNFGFVFRWCTLVSIPVCSVVKTVASLQKRVKILFKYEQPEMPCKIWIILTDVFKVCILH